MTLGLYGSVHDPASDLSITLGFADTITMKVWLATAAVLFALIQLGSALWLFGKVRRARLRPGWEPIHRMSGRLAFLFSLPVAYHCLYQLAFQDTTVRVLLHSILGCAFYGAFAVKVVSCARRRCPDWRSRSRAGDVQRARRDVDHERALVHLRERVPLPVACSPA